VLQRARRLAPRHRQDRHPRRHPPQAGKAHRRGVGRDAPASEVRPRPAVADRLLATRARHPLLSPREVGRHGLSTRARGREIPLPARLFAIADVWDALSSDWPYRLAYRPRK
jgi:hypothetical protein